jgi:nucleotide-binding universal stress UspA family protein
MLKSILVPLDGSAFAEEALPTALAIAARESARLELVIAHEVLPAYRVQGAPPRDSRLDNEIREERSRYVDGVDLIAIATHGRGVAGRLLVGSVADKVLRGATVPVLIHRPTIPTPPMPEAHAVAYAGESPGSV